MTPEPTRSGRRRLRLTLLAGALGIAALAGSLVAAVPATASPAASPTPTATPTATATATPVVGNALAVDLAKGTVLTLPARDGVRDRTTVRVRSGASGRIDVDAIRGTRTVHLGTRLPLLAGTTGWARTVAVPVAHLTAGTWRIRAKRSSGATAQARSGTFVVGSGRPVHVLVHPAARTLYPYKDGSLDTEIVTVIAKDETQSVVPVTGSIRIDAGKRHVTRTLSTAGTARLPITALPLGAATMTTSVRDAAGAAVRRTPLTLAPTGVGSLRIARSSDTVEPVLDGLLDSVVLTTSGAASAGSPAKVSGTLTVDEGADRRRDLPGRGRRPARVHLERSGAGRRRAGHVHGHAVAEGTAGTGSDHDEDASLVTKAHLPTPSATCSRSPPGNQQGLAVRNGMFYVGYDIGNGQSRIDVYDGAGLLVSSLGPLPIPHVAELAYSTTTADAVRRDRRREHAHEGLRARPARSAVDGGAADRPRPPSSARCSTSPAGSATTRWSPSTTRTAGCSCSPDRPGASPSAR